jgi:hypothetical protein
MKTRAGLLALMAVVSVSCGPVPRPSPSQAVLGTATPPPKASITPPPVTPAASPEALVAHDISQAFTTPLLDATTDGTHLIWSKGTPGSTDGAPFLYEYTFGEPAPSLVYSDSDKTATISPIAVGSSGLAFVEEFSRGGSSIGWRLFYLPQSASRPILVETSEMDPASFNGLIPQIAITNRYLVWTAVHAVNGVGQFSIRAYSLDSGHVSTLQTALASKTEYWFPNADSQDRLVYSTVEHSAPGAAVSFHVYFIDNMATPTLQPSRLDSDGDATNPVISGDTVVWKKVVDNVTNYGDALFLYSLSGGRSRTITLPDQPFVATPSVGNRYLAVWGMDATRLQLFDCAKNQAFDVFSNPPSRSSPAYVRPVVAGNVLAFISGSNDPSVPLQLSWMYLPPPP